MPTGQKSAGHPVDVATGVVFSKHTDIDITGRFPLTWERHYSTALLEMAPGPLGPGWTTAYFSTLKQTSDGYAFIEPRGDEEFFQAPQGRIAGGETIFNFSAFQELRKQKDSFIVTHWDVETYETTRFIFKQGEPGEPWPLQRIENITGQGLDLFYDEKGRLLRIHQEIEKRDLLLAYNQHNRITAVVVILADNSRHVRAQYDYDDQQRLAAAYNAMGHSDQYGYDRDHRMVREYIKDGAAYVFDYDHQGRCIHTSGTEGYDRKSFRYNGQLGRTEVKDSHGQITFYYWKPETGQVFEEVNPAGAVFKTGYDEHDRIVSKTNPNGSVTCYAYDKQGNRCGIINSLGQTTTVLFNDLHQPLRVINAAGHTWRRYYNENHQVVCIENPQEGRYAFKYDAKGGLVEITDPLGRQRGQTFNPDGSLESATDWLGNCTHFSIDGFGRIIKAVDPAGNPTTYQYDPLDNLTRIDFADGTSTLAQYDESGNLTQITDRNGHATQYAYASYNRLVERTDALGQTIKVAWDSEPDRMISLTNPKGEIHRYEYNATGEVIREIGFDGRELQYTYDPYGNCVATVNGLGERIAYDRDVLGRLVCVTQPNGEKNTYQYDDVGFLAGAGNAETRITFERDSLGRIVREMQNGCLIEREFDRVGNIRQLKSDLDLTIDYRFDGNGQLKQVTLNNSDRIELNRNALGLETHRRLSRHVDLEQQYDAMGRLTEQTVIADNDNPFRSLDNHVKPLIQRNYQYGGGNLTRIRDNFWGSTSYRYDPLQRLTQALREFGESETFKFDQNDNLTHIAQGQSKSELTYAAGDRLERRGNTLYVHDAQGRLVEKSEILPDGAKKKWTYTWDALDQLRSVTNPEGQAWEYAYDPFKRRIKKASSGGRVQRFFWDEDVVLHELEDGKNPISWVFDPHSFNPMCKLEGDRLYAVVTDHLGTPRELLDRQGRIVWRVDYHARGGVRKQAAGDVECPVRFAGQWYDKESGLCYNRFRYYDFETGRYISCDPIGLAGGVNQYGYVVDPNLWIDPFGLCGDGDSSKSSDDDIENILKRDFYDVDEAASAALNKSVAETRYLGKIGPVKNRDVRRDLRRAGYDPNDFSAVQYEAITDQGERYIVTVFEAEGGVYFGPHLSSANF